jgi:hypothetical protein
MSRVELFARSSTNSGYATSTDIYIYGTSIGSHTNLTEVFFYLLRYSPTPYGDISIKSWLSSFQLKD